VHEVHECTGCGPGTRSTPLLARYVLLDSADVHALPGEGTLLLLQGAAHCYVGPNEGIVVVHNT